MLKILWLNYLDNLGLEPMDSKQIIACVDKLKNEKIPKPNVILIIDKLKFGIKELKLEKK